VIYITQQIRNEIQDIKAIKEQVVYIYNRFPAAIESDNVLFFEYILPLFYNISLDQSLRYVIDFIKKNNISFESYSRAGRELREKYPERFARRTTKEKCELKELAYRLEYA